LLDDGGSVWHAYYFWAGFSVICAFFGVMLTVYVGPGAMGSGVPEVMGLLNGVRYPKALDVATLFVKIIGVELAVLSNLAVGKEGPLVHIGAIIGAMSPYIPMDCFSPFRNDSDKRTFIAAGCSAGISAAFGAPIGGALFSYEISKPNTFWSFSMLWRVFFTSAMSTLTLGLLSELHQGIPLTLNSAAVLKFGEISYFDTPMFDAVIAIGMGIICGVLGAFFIYMYAALGAIRKKKIDTPFKKIAEVIFFSFISTSLFYWLSAACPICYSIN
jgi:chloride channel 7